MSDNFDDLINSARDAERAAEHRRQVSRESHADAVRAGKEKHAALAKKFIGAMRDRGCAPLPVYINNGDEDIRVRVGLFRGSRPSSRPRPPRKIGEGWIIRDYYSRFEPDDYYSHWGLVLMTDGRVYQYDRLGAPSSCVMPEPHLYISQKHYISSPGRDGHEPDQCLASPVEHEFLKRKSADPRAMRGLFLAQEAAPIDGQTTSTGQSSGGSVARSVAKREKSPALERFAEQLQG